MLLLSALSLLLALDPVAGLKVPDGFTVTPFAGPELANDIYGLHIDARGRVVVAGRRYVRQLVDADSDGRADKAVELVPAPADGPMGLLWEGDTLFVTSDGGVKRYTGVTGKGPTGEKPTTIIKLKTSGEHDAHAIRRGPDGKIYVLCGNMAGLSAKTVTAKDSPVSDPVAGGLLRLNDDGTEVAVIADGFRNPYDFDFDTTGTPFTFDSDNERCVGLPWYEPTRFYRILSGGNYGWLSPQHAQTWRLPPYWPSVVPPVVTAGRGSPTGVACYRHTRFPKEYQGGFFYADWTFGTIWFTQPGDPKPTAKPFLTVSGENGFAPTGLAVDPTSGDLFVSIGGRGTRGAVYRISHTKAEKGTPIPFDPKPLPRWEKPAAVPLKPEALTNAKTDREKLAVVCGWFDALGGVGDPKVKGSVWEGYTFRKPPKAEVIAPLVAAVQQVYPSPDETLNRELLRFLSAAKIPSRVAEELTKQKDPLARVHTLIARARMPGPLHHEDATSIADALLCIDSQYAMRGLVRDSNWTPRLSETVAALINHDRAIMAALLGHPSFGCGEHVWLVRAAAIDSQKAGKAFAKHSASGQFEWQAGHAEYIGALDEKTARPLLKRIADAGFKDAAAVQLAQWPKQEDRSLFVGGLGSTSTAVVTKCARALAAIGMKDDELVPLIRALRRFPDPEKDSAVRTALLSLLKAHTREAYDDAAKWEAWLTEKHPELTKKLGGAGYDAAAWRKRLAKIDFDAGNAEKGKKVFAKAQCAACHNGTTAVGPSLVGVTRRFGRDDLLTALLDPNRDVADRYRTVRFTTADQVYEGVVIYQAADGVLLQTSADTTIRLPGQAIESRKPGANSLMPAGLLDALSDAEVADLLAYLKGL
ncbi:MAG: c-type cytochrome [Fimbriiglobus sp.]|nr:c-type cytochrome [Fimbriiglobus sp.]